jgi:hypothetical protein
VADNPKEMNRYYGLYDGDWLMDERKLRVYLACPYSHEEIIVMKERVYCATQCAAKIFESGYLVYSPLTHTVPLARFLPSESKTGWPCWRDISLTFVDWADQLWVLTLPGWDESTGVQAEIAHAAEHFKPIKYFSVKEIQNGVILRVLICPDCGRREEFPLKPNDWERICPSCGSDMEEPVNIKTKGMRPRPNAK